jgi:hypothetical protein
MSRFSVAWPFRDPSSTQKNQMRTLRRIFCSELLLLGLSTASWAQPIVFAAPRPGFVLRAAIRFGPPSRSVGPLFAGVGGLGRHSSGRRTPF